MKILQIFRVLSAKAIIFNLAKMRMIHMLIIIEMAIMRRIIVMT